MSADPVHDPVRPATPGPWHHLRDGLKPLASLQLTVVLFVLAVLLVFFGTLAQIDFGIWTTIDQYFYSWVVWVPFDLVNKFGQVFLADYFPKDRPPWSGSFPLPGGKLLGGLMAVNLLAAHLTRFRLTWKRSGVILIHAGLLLLLVGEVVTREFAVEQQMAIPEGGSADYAEDARSVELAFLDGSDPAADKVTVIPRSLLVPGSRVSHPDLPVDVEVLSYMKNSAFKDPGPGVDNPATAGQGREVVAVPAKEESGVATNQRGDLPSAYLRLHPKGGGPDLGTYLVSRLFSAQNLADRVAVGGKTYRLSLRPVRYYKPYSIHLIDFRFDRYPGTNTPRNYSSQVVLKDPERGVERELTISMNSPLRHRGETFYQSSFDQTETSTVLQVVKNPGWLIPYVSCVVVTVGLVTHFGIYLTQFLRRRAAA